MTNWIISLEQCYTEDNILSLNIFEQDYFIDLYI